ncbi:flagellar hook-associated protein FlgK, partial [bacterium 1XD42-8]
STVESIENSRQMVMGVSSSEELTNMIKFQNAYNASSRYINVVSEMLEHLITRLGG